MVLAKLKPISVCEKHFSLEWYILNSNIALCSPTTPANNRIHFLPTSNLLIQGTVATVLYSTLTKSEKWNTSLRNRAATNERRRKSWQVFVAGNNIQAHPPHVVIAWLIYKIVRIHYRVTLLMLLHLENKNCARFEFKRSFWPCFNWAFLVLQCGFAIQFKETIADARSSAFSMTGDMRTYVMHFINVENQMVMFWAGSFSYKIKYL